MGEKDTCETNRRSQFGYWLTLIQVRLRFFAFVALLAILFALWPWLSAAWDRNLPDWFNKGAELAVGGGSEFFCPMDPGVVSNWPAICPICNMDLIRRTRGDAQILPEGAIARMQFSPYKLALAGIRTSAIERESADVSSIQATGQLTSDTVDVPSIVRVPASAIVYREQQPLVYIESMPGMFDAIPVTLHSRAGNVQVVAGKLIPGQRVAVEGTWLLDAESRLKPNLSTQYFGASQPSSSTLAPSLPIPKAKTGMEALPPEDRRLVDLQMLCPVTKLPLGSMGSPVFVIVNERRVALCCAGCRGRLVSDPDKYLKWLDQQFDHSSQNHK